MKFAALILVVLIFSLVGFRVAGIDTEIPDLDRSVAQLMDSVGLPRGAQ